MGKRTLSIESREMKIKSTIRYYFTLTRMAIILKRPIMGAGEDVEKRKPSYIAGTHVQWGSSLAVPKKS